jgi:hypothetical protein
MPSPELWLVCITAFVAVGLLLSILAGLMRLILVVFPQREQTTDAMLVAAVASVVTNLYPGSRVTKVEEIQC